MVRRRRQAAALHGAARVIIAGGNRRPHRSGACAGPPIPRANERTRTPQKWCRGMLGHGNLFEGYPAVFVADQRAKRAGESSRVRRKRLRPVNVGCEQSTLGHVLRQVNEIRGWYLSGRIRLHPPRPRCACGGLSVPTSGKRGASGSLWYVPTGKNSATPRLGFAHARAIPAAMRPRGVSRVRERGPRLHPLYCAAQFWCNRCGARGRGSGWRDGGDGSASACGQGESVLAYRWATGSRIGGRLNALVGA